MRISSGLVAIAVLALAGCPTPKEPADDDVGEEESGPATEPPADKSETSGAEPADDALTCEEELKVRTAELEVRTAELKACNEAK